MGIDRRRAPGFRINGSSFLSLAPRMISDESLDEYRRIHECAFGKPISREEALPQAIALLEIARAALRYPEYGAASSVSDSTRSPSGV